MNWKYPTFGDYEKAKAIRGFKRPLCGVSIFNAARETVEEEDVEQIATLERVRGRDGWARYNDDWLVYGEYVSFSQCHMPKLVVGGITEHNPTRRQLIAAEELANALRLA